MGKRARRETEIFSISFLDCITCGLGSVVLLLVFMVGIGLAFATDMDPTVLLQYGYPLEAKGGLRSSVKV